MSNPATGDIAWRTASGETMTLSTMTDKHLLFAMMKLQRNCMERYGARAREYTTVEASRFHLTKICQLAGEYANRNLLPAEIDTEEQLWNWLLVQNDNYAASKGDAANRNRQFNNHQEHIHVNEHREVTTVTQYQPPARPVPVVVEVERKLVFTPL